jgi:hypothetical protein
MLKLQRKAYHKDIAIRLRDSDPVFTKNMLLGIFIAFFLHVTPFLTIKIDSTDEKMQFTRQSITVEADVGASAKGQGVITTLQIDEHGFLPRYILEPEAAIPGLPDMPRVVVEHQLDNTRGSEVTGEVFTQVETVSYVTSLKRLAYEAVETPVRIRISGPLATRPASVKDFRKLIQTAMEVMLDGEYRVTMNVRVNDKTGEVFWFAIKDSSTSEALDTLAVNMVRKLAFDKENEAFVTEGEIEVLFTR